MRQHMQTLVPDNVPDRPGKGTVAARAFADDLRGRLSVAPAIGAGYRLPLGLVPRAEQRFLGRTLEQHEATIEHVSRISLLDDVDYWLEHARVTRDLMRAFASRHGANVPLYGDVGRLHDADYLRHPHLGPYSVPPVHPLPLALFLAAEGVHEAVCLAIMEHAGYIGQGSKFSTRMSAALSACDDLATYAAAVDPCDLRVRRDLSPAAQMLLGDISPPRVRIDIDRACPTRVLSKPDLYINHSLNLAQSSQYSFEL